MNDRGPASAEGEVRGDIAMEVIGWVLFITVTLPAWGIVWELHDIRKELKKWREYQEEKKREAKEEEEAG